MSVGLQLPILLVFTAGRGTVWKSKENEIQRQFNASYAKGANQRKIKAPLSY